MGLSALSLPPPPPRLSPQSLNANKNFRSLKPALPLQRALQSWSTGCGPSCLGRVALDVSAAVQFIVPPNPPGSPQHTLIYMCYGSPLLLGSGMCSGLVAALLCGRWDMVHAWHHLTTVTIVTTQYMGFVGVSPQEHLGPWSKMSPQSTGSALWSVLPGPDRTPQAGLWLRTDVYAPSRWAVEECTCDAQASRLKCSGTSSPCSDHSPVWVQSIRRGLCAGKTPTIT